MPAITGNNSGFRVLSWPVMPAAGAHWFFPRALPPPVAGLERLAPATQQLLMMTSMEKPLGSFYDISGELDGLMQPPPSTAFVPHIQVSNDELSKLDKTNESMPYLHLIDRESMPGLLTDPAIGPRSSQIDTGTGFPYLSALIQP
ncbi:unnamed protein product [Echinostoma caproni]|uniref:Transcription factor SOX-13 n=1 Tax=Echinostoma caproni TaxID=27848 RepID=A0A183A6L9_9TREM|nr:unnamed protein product [Echinostoma caproni]